MLYLAYVCLCELLLQMGEEGKEQHMDVQGLEEVMICTQGKNSAVVFSTSQNSADELAVTTDEVISSSILATAREEISNIVMLVIDNVFEAMYQPITQCNNSEITAGENSLFSLLPL